MSLEMPQPRDLPSIMFRVFQGMDGVLRYVNGQPMSTDRIVWGEEQPYRVRFHWKGRNAVERLANLQRYYKRLDDLATKQLREGSG